MSESLQLRSQELEFLFRKHRIQEYQALGTRTMVYLSQDTKHNVRVQCTFVGFVHDNGRVAVEVRLAQEHALRHGLDDRLVERQIYAQPSLVLTTTRQRLVRPYPTSSPMVQPISSRTRCATDMAATRRGCVHPIMPNLEYRSSCMY